MEARDSRWVSVAEVALHLGVARDTVYRWIESRSMPAHRVGRLWKFQLSDVDAWVISGKANVSYGSAPEQRSGDAGTVEYGTRTQFQ